MINPLNVKDMNYLVHPQDLVFKAKAHIEGFNLMVKESGIPQWDLLETAMVKESGIPQWDLLETALNVAEEWTLDWSEDEGFGSSDGTYMLKDFIDNVIWKYTNGGKYMTKFTPSLSVVPYSEEEHHERVQRMESGI